VNIQGGFGYKEVKGTHHGHDLSEVAHGLQDSSFLFITIRDNNLRPGLGYVREQAWG
jgi:hypothetical protein